MSTTKRTYDEFLESLYNNYNTERLEKIYTFLKKRLAKPITKSADGVEFISALDQCSNNLYMASTLLKTVTHIKDVFEIDVYDKEINDMKRKVESYLEEKKRNKEISGQISIDRILTYIRTHPDTKERFRVLRKKLIEHQNAVDLMDRFTKAWEVRCRSLHNLSKMERAFIVGRH